VADEHGGTNFEKKKKKSSTGHVLPALGHISYNVPPVWTHVVAGPATTDGRRRRASRSPARGMAF